MGIPAAFRWLSTKYPKIISPVVEDQPVTMPDGTVIPVDTTRPNPNKEEFDNLYLDMNGIVHPCSHPEDKPAPADEEEMMAEIFKYTDRVVNMVRPRKLLMIAVDGVAPRAKMNQQRSRRFRAAQDAKDKEDGKQELIKMLKKQNGGVLEAESAETVAKKAFDSNSITPGTPFMDILAASLRYWCAYKLNTDPAWAKMKVIISDATVPGEGEHKIMEFVRSQRNSPDHDPNTRHVIYGLDADLIMLGLATHEPHFRVLREDVFFQDSKARMCKLCGQEGHEASQCKGEAKEKDGEFDEKDKAHPLKPFIWLHVSILREYLAAELEVPGLPFRFDLERALDDWVFMCFFVGNDFLPHLPALEIRENGIDTLTAIWKDNLPHMGGYLTKDGHVDLERAQYIMNGLAKQEDAIFRRRKETEERREAGFKRRRLQQGNGQDPPHAKAPPSIQTITHETIVNRQAVDQASAANKSAASMLKSQIQTLLGKSASGSSKDGGDGDAEKAPTLPASALGKRKAAEMEENSSGPGTPPMNSSGAGEEGPVDTVKLWEEGYADRYYEQKFHVDPRDVEFRHKVARAYTEGLAWVLMYYFQGCPSWEWFYPYHYAPFAADFVDLGKMTIKFDKGRISRPFEQLMSVLPAASRHAIPEVFHDLMTNPDSNIIDFYPEDFEVDLNGKKMAWQGVALLPFIDMPRLLTAMDTKYPLLGAADKARNEVGRDVLLLSDSHPTLYDDVTLHFYSKKQGTIKYKLNGQVSDGLSGKITKIEGYLPHGSLPYPLSRNSMPDVEYDRSLSVHYEFPGSSHQHKSMLLRGVKLPKPALDRTDIEVVKGKAQRSGRSYGGVPLNGRGRGGYQGGYQGNGADRGGRGPPINYGPGGGRSDRGSYDYKQHQPPPSRQYDGYGNGGYGQAPPPHHFPPPPGQGQYSYGRGGPPPPPLTAGYGGASYGGGNYGGGNYGGGEYGRGNHGGGDYGRGNYGGGSYGARQQHAPAPPPGVYAGHYQGQQYRPPPPPGAGPRLGQDRHYGGRSSYDDRKRGYRDSGGYR